MHVINFNLFCEQIFYRMFLNSNEIPLFWLTVFLAPQSNEDAYEPLMFKRLIIKEKRESCFEKDLWNIKIWLFSKIA